MTIDTNNAERLATLLERADEYGPLGHDGWEAATLIRAQAAEIKQARQTAEYWKAAHLAGNTEIDRLRGLLWYAWFEFNAIRARSGAPLTHDGMTIVSEEWWDQMTEAFKAAIGEDDAKPWPSPEAGAALVAAPRGPRCRR